MPKHTAWESAAILAFGITFLAVLLFIAKFFPDPTPFQYTIFRVVLALSAAGVAALTPHFLDINIPGIRAGGAFAVFVLVYSYSPASLVVQLPSSEELPRIDDRGLVRWRPFPPVSLGQGRSPSPSSIVRSRSAVSTTNSHAIPGPGSRSKMSRSGCSMSSTMAAQGCSSTASIATSASNPSTLSTQTRTPSPPSRFSICSSWTAGGGCDNEFRPMRADEFWPTFRDVMADPIGWAGLWVCAVWSSLMPLLSCAEPRCGGTDRSPHPW
jgi:hypothetical protein